MPSRIFVSSTCYDLVDLRAELEHHLREIGLVPVLSDRASSDFRVEDGQEAIETCLANLRSCDAVVFVLSQRYGHSLKQAGYPDLSATHLEYREARRLNKPIHFFVRDRLDAEYSIWLKNQGATPHGAHPFESSWVRPGDADRLFKLMQEHAELQKGGRNNWYWTFRDSIDLKSILSKSLKLESSKAILRRLMENGKLPAFEVKLASFNVDNDGYGKATFQVRNVSQSAALEVAVLLSERLEELGTLGPQDAASVSFRDILLEDAGEPGDTKRYFRATPEEVECFVRVDYYTPQGYHIEDIYEMHAWHYRGELMVYHWGRRFLGQSGIRLLAESE